MGREPSVLAYRLSGSRRTRYFEVDRSRQLTYLGGASVGGRVRARIRSAIGTGDDLVWSCGSSSWRTALSLLFTLRQGLRRRNLYSLRAFVFFFVQTTIHPSTNIFVSLSLSFSSSHTLTQTLPRSLSLSPPLSGPLPLFLFHPFSRSFFLSLSLSLSSLFFPLLQFTSLR